MSSKTKNKASRSSRGKRSCQDQPTSNANYYSIGEAIHQVPRRDELEESDWDNQEVENMYSNTTTVANRYIQPTYSYSASGNTNHQENYTTRTANTDRSSTSHPLDSVPDSRYHQDDYYQGQNSRLTVSDNSCAAATDLNWPQPMVATQRNITSIDYTSQTPRSTSMRMSQAPEIDHIQQESSSASFSSANKMVDPTNFQIEDVSPDADEGTLFGRICTDIGIFEGLEDHKYQKAHGSRGSRKLLWNPQRLQSNCFFVCIGKLLNKPWAKLSGSLGLRSPTHLQGVKLGEIEQILHRIGGLRIIVLPALEEYGDPEYQQHIAFHLLGEKLTRFSKNRSFIIGYRRSGVVGPSTGHCVIAKLMAGGGITGHHLSHYNFLCYQNDDRGKNMFEDVKGSYIKFAIFQSEEANIAHMDFYHETSNAGVFNHVQLSNDTRYTTYPKASAQPSHATQYTTYLTPSDLETEGMATSTSGASYTYPTPSARVAAYSSVFTSNYDQDDSGRHY